VWTSCRSKSGYQQRVTAKQFLVTEIISHETIPTGGYPTAHQPLPNRIRGVYSVETKIVLIFVNRASHYKFMVMTNLTHFSMYLFISCLYMF
jgi:hypothetical protein